MASTKGSLRNFTRTFSLEVRWSSPRLSIAFWSSMRILSPALSKMTTSSSPSRVRVVWTFSFPAVAWGRATSSMPPRRSWKGLLRPPISTLLLLQCGHVRSVGREYFPHSLHLYPRCSATLDGASFGSRRTPTDSARMLSSLSTSSASRTSRNGLSGFSGFLITLTSCLGWGRFMDRARAIMDFPVPGGPTSSRCLRCLAAILASSMASSWPRTLSRGSEGMRMSAVDDIPSRSSQVSTALFCVISTGLPSSRSRCPRASW